MLPPAFDQLLRGDLDAQVHDLVAVVREDDLDQVLADVVNVSPDGREHDLSLERVGRLLHELLEMSNGGFHRFRGLEDLGDDQLVVVEEPAHLAHAVHQRSVDDLERRPSRLPHRFQVNKQTIF